jgi:VCBS repeat-containing protein
MCLSLIAQVGAAETLIWNENGASKTDPPRSIYSYKYKGGSSYDVRITLDTTKITAVPYYMEATFTADEGAKGGAGFGFYWNVDEDGDYEPVRTSLAGYSGVCLNYSAANPVRMDFKQDNIDDDNYFGIMLPATDGNKVNKFVAFDELKMGWKGETTWKWNAARQLGLQFSYKGEHVKKYGTENEVGIYMLMLGDECPQHLPVVFPDAPTRVVLNEGGKYYLHLSDVFYDEDGDSLSFHLAPTGSGVNTDYDDTKSLTLNDSIMFMAVTNPKSTDSLKVVLTATEVKSNKKITHNMVFKPIDLEHVPTIRDTTYELLQGNTIGCTGKCSFYDTFAYDLDEDEFDLYLLDEPEFGEFTFDAEKGQFTYVAPSDTFGEVYFSLYAIETDNPTSVSDTVKFKISVLDINDPPTVEILDSAINYVVGDGDTAQIKLDNSKTFIEMDEDFEDSISVFITADNAVFSDVDSDIKMRVKTNGLVNAEIATIGKFQYILVTAKKDANGLAKVTYYADDGEFQAGVDFYVKVAPVDDPPVAVDDKYDAVQDSTIKVAAKKGVLANDKNPDDPDAELTAKIKTKPEHGKLTLSDDGSFKYEADAAYRGEVTFTYVCVNDAGVESSPATVTITVAGRNMAPVVREGVADSLETLLADLEEDKISSAKSFAFKAMNTWFEDPDGDALTFDAINEDGKLVISKSKTAITFALAQDSCGESEITFIATDSLGAETKLTIPVKIKAVNDAPVPVISDKILAGVKLTDWTLEYDLDTLMKDVDDTLTYALSKNNTKASKYLDLELKGSVLKVKPKEKLVPYTDYEVVVDVKDSKTTVQLTFVFTTDRFGSSGLRAVALTKLNWQGAIAADRGMAVMMDMQGRVMWKAKLPVSEAEVRGAAAAVQGRKILRVNNQTWTIK